MGTYAYQCACGAIEAWNDSPDLIEIGCYPEEEFKDHCYDPIKYIVAEPSCKPDEKDFLHCRSIIAMVGEQKFKISSRYVGDGKYGFCYESFSSFNPKFWPLKINSAEKGPITFSAENDSSGQGSSLVFHVGEKTLSITAEKSYLTMTPIEGLLEET